MKKQTKPKSVAGVICENPQQNEEAAKGQTLFPIVGIGASAGGLEALELFLRKVPEDCGMAFVIVQHMDPTHVGVMPELLQRTTRMRVCQVSERMRVKPNCVYVIPPNTNLSITHGVLHLFDPIPPRGLRLPIDFFLTSLAEDKKEHSIGVILSGMGSDGTMGLKAIKGKAGLVLVQEPTSAKFDSMPRSAINAGLADIVALAEDLPEKIISYLHHIPTSTKSELPIDQQDQSSLEKVLILIRNITGHDFSMYKKNTLYRRIERRMSLHHIAKIALYVQYLRENPIEAELLFKELLIGVTSFFRDPDAWDELKEDVIPTLLKRYPTGKTLRAWSTGCSSGEEAYSLAIAFNEALEQIKPTENFALQIFATDVSQDAIDKARHGVYPASIASDVSPERLHRYFTKDGDCYRICKEIRGMVTFATQNVATDPPFTKLDILICRNLLIYLTPELQKKLMPLFHYSLAPGGVLFLGGSESVNTLTDLFKSRGNKPRLFWRSESVLPVGALTFSSSVIPPRLGIPKELSMSEPVANLQSLADQMLLQHYSPPAVLVNDNGDILYINGRTGKYLEPAAGKANFNIFAMAREGLRFDLESAFHKAARLKETVTVKNLRVGTNGGTQIIDLTIQPTKESEALRGLLMILFYDVTMPLAKKAKRLSHAVPADKARALELEHELQGCREELQTTREEMQSSHEELLSANEELQSTNEELQSTNEELTTSREEMQSLNEELHTINAEQLSKMDEFSWANNDMKNLLNSTEIVTVFLDNQLNIRRFTTGADKLFKLIPGDVGRPLSDIVSDLSYPEMLEEAQEVLRTLVFSEKQITTTGGNWYLVRIMPYRTTEDVITGVVITFSNITAAKTLEAELRQEIAKLKGEHMLKASGVVASTNGK
jgi:two-component system CheB/CheR fusion protein